MTTDQLASFLAVAETGNFTEAAERLYLTQSSVSKHIKSLELELGVSLFARSSRKVHLTQAGESALAEAHKMNLAYQRLKETMLDFAEHDGLRLRVSSIPVMPQYNITGLLSDFAKKYPNIILDIQETEGIDMYSNLESGAIDLAFLRTSETRGNLDSIPLFRDRLCVVLSTDHALAECPELSITELSGENFLLPKKKTLLYDLCLNLCEKGGFSPKVIYTGTRMGNILALVQKNHGVSLMMHQVASYFENTHIRVIPLKEEVVSVIGLAKLHTAKLNTAAQKLWEYAAAIRIPD